MTGRVHDRSCGQSDSDSRDSAETPNSPTSNGVEADHRRPDFRAWRVGGPCGSREQYQCQSGVGVAPPLCARLVTASPVTAVRSLDPQQQQAELVRTLRQQESMTERLMAQQQRAIAEARTPGRCDSSACGAVPRRLAKPAALAAKVELSRQLEAVYRSELKGFAAGQRSAVPIFTSDFFFGQKHDALRLANTRRTLALKAIDDARLAIESREREYPNTDLSSYRKELERLALLLRNHSIQDQTLESFTALGEENSADSVRTNREPR